MERLRESEHDTLPQAAASSSGISTSPEPGAEAYEKY